MSNSSKNILMDLIGDLSEITKEKLKEKMEETDEEKESDNETGIESGIESENGIYESGIESDDVYLDKELNKLDLRELLSEHFKAKNQLNIAEILLLLKSSIDKNSSRLNILLKKMENNVKNK